MKGRKADVILAAYNAAEVALRLVRPGADVSIGFHWKEIVYENAKMIRSNKNTGVFRVTQPKFAGET